jgi:hypothetical protein
MVVAQGHADHYDFGLVSVGLVFSFVAGLLTDLVVAFAAGKFEA